MTTSDIMKNISVYINDELEGCGLYMEWLSERIKNFQEILCPYSYLDVYDNEDGSITFRFRADDCVQAEFKWKNEKLWLISPFLDDDERGDITADEFDRRLREFAAHHGLRHVITSDLANKEMEPWVFMR